MKKIIAVIASMIAACGLCSAASVDGVTHALHSTNGFAYAYTNVAILVTVPSDALWVRIINTSGASNAVFGAKSTLTVAGLYSFTTLSAGGSVTFDASNVIPQFAIYCATADASGSTSNRIDWTIFQK
jgi:hypothetical protein